ncbi:MAG: hypothetical protein JNG85_12070, partial [Spirochaetaceae bacterium]|nr:hypothetical protein [Spirochaetaceae bacterium]
AAALIFSLVTLPGSVAEGESATAASPSAARAGASGSAGTAALAAAGLRSLPPEAPSSLFAVEFGGSDVEFLVRGSWELKLLSQGSLESSAASGLRLAEFQPLLFSQRPDLFLSFLLFDRIFVEARVSDDLSQARYAAGYRGVEGEALREIRIGNDGISFPTLPFLSFGQGSRRSFGIAASVGSDAFDGRAMLRYDQADRVEKRFIGGAELAETVLRINQFLRGRWFATLDAPPATNLLVYVESTTGTLVGSDGRKYRQLDQGEYSYSSSSGVVSLSRAAATRVAASYTELSAPHSAFAIDGRSVSLLFDPLVRYDSANSETKTELLNRYAMVETSGADAFVRDLASGLRDESFEVRIDPAGYLEVSRGGIVDPRDLGGRFSRPFEARVSELYTRDYGEDGPKAYLPYLPLEIVIRRARAVSEISVDKDLVAGSVELRRNGVPDYAFTVDADAGVLKLATPPGLQEEITVSYLRESSERRAGSLAAGIGGTLNLGPDRAVWTALGLRWSLPGQSYAAGGVSNPGSVVLTAGERDGEGAFRHRAALAGTWTTEEASGRYRVEGMEASGGFGSSFSPLSALPTGAGVVEIQEAALRARFPTYMDATHRDGTVQQALRLAAGAGGAVSLAKIEATVPLAKLKTFSFFARGPAGASLTLALDEGAVGTEALAVTVPAGQLATTWRRYTFAYASVDAALRYLDAEGGAGGTVAGATTKFDLSRAGATRLRIETTGLAGGEELWIDEIVLEESTGRAALLFDGQLSFADPELRLGPEGFPLLRGLDLKADAAAGLQTGSYLTGGLSFGAGFGPLDLIARLRGSLAEGAAAGSSVDARLRGGHELGLPLGPATLRDRFDFDPSTGSFGRENVLSLRAGAVA